MNPEVASFDKNGCERPIKMRKYDAKFGKVVENSVALFLELCMPTAGTRTRPVPLLASFTHHTVVCKISLGAD